MSPLQFDLTLKGNIFLMRLVLKHCCADLCANTALTLATSYCSRWLMAIMMQKYLRFFNLSTFWQSLISLRLLRSRRVRFGVLSVFAAATCTVLVAPVRAVPLEELLFRGIQVLQISNLSQQQEMQLGAQMHENLRQQGTRLSTDEVLTRYVTDVGQRLVGSSGRRIPYRFHLVEQKGINAFATMGGYVYVTTGLMRAADNEAQLASVMGHEIGHIEKRHLIAQIKQNMIARGLVASTLGQSQLANMGVDLLVSRPMSRQDEYQADQVGLRILRDSNYAISAMPTFMRKLVRGGSGTPTFLSSHPAVPARIKALEKEIATGATNRCSSDRRLESCGLDETAYQSQVKQRFLS
jgi:beta-barrel assembly-enhancing protease